VRVRPEEGRLEVELERGMSASRVLAALEELGAEVESLELEEHAEGRSMLVALRYGSRAQAGDAADRIAGLSGVRRLQWVP
jgi:hypothetical protein